MAIVILLAIQTFFSAIVSGSDEMKVIFAVVINPVMCELLLLTPARFAARALRHNHPSTSFVVVAVFVFFKQYLGRTVVALIDTSSWVFVVSIASCLGEVFFRVTLKSRDKAIYRCLFSRWLPPGTDSANLLVHERNVRLRANNSMVESIGEIVAIWNGVTMVILFDISLDGKSPMNIWKAVWAGLVQTAFEILADCISLLLLRLMGVRVLEYVQGRYWYWSATFCPALMFVSAYGLDSFLSRTLCYKPGFEAVALAPCQRL